MSFRSKIAQISFLVTISIALVSSSARENEHSHAPAPRNPNSSMGGQSSVRSGRASKAGSQHSGGSQHSRGPQSQMVSEAGNSRLQERSQGGSKRSHSLPPLASARSGGPHSNFDNSLVSSGRGSGAASKSIGGGLYGNQQSVRSTSPVSQAKSQGGKRVTFASLSKSGSGKTGAAKSGFSGGPHGEEQSVASARPSHSQGGFTQNGATRSGSQLKSANSGFHGPRSAGGSQERSVISHRSMVSGTKGVNSVASKRGVASQFGEGLSAMQSQGFSTGSAGGALPANEPCQVLSKAEIASRGLLPAETLEKMDEFQTDGVTPRMYMVANNIKGTVMTSLPKEQIEHFGGLGTELALGAMDLAGAYSDMQSARSGLSANGIASAVSGLENVSSPFGKSNSQNMSRSQQQKSRTQGSQGSYRSAAGNEPSVMSRPAGSQGGRNSQFGSQRSKSGSRSGSLFERSQGGIQSQGGSVRKGGSYADGVSRTHGSVTL